MKKAFLITTLFVAVVLGIGSVIGIMNIPGDWYQELRKPPFNPPNWIFGPVWSTLYVLIGVAGARNYLRGDRLRMALWSAQLVLNFAWSPAFFGLQNPTLALAVIVPLLALIILYVAVSARRDRVSAALFVPYAIWVLFAALLNTSIVMLN